MGRWSSLLAAAFGAMITFAAGSARADLFSDCGGAVFNGNESCTLIASADCMASCQPPNLELACSAQLEASCSGGCTATLPSCQGSCMGTCMGSCSGNPGKFDCNADCSGSCEANCAGECMGNANSSQCETECKASCGFHCDAQCKGGPPMASCSAACMASCQGSCSGQANLACDVSCQAMGNASCTAKLQGGCQASCNAQTAFSCNGQFINATDANACANDLKNLFQITITGWSYAEASSGCDGGVCSAQAAAGAGANASAKCDVSPGAPPFSGGMLAIGLGGVIAGVVRRRRKTS